MKNCIICGEPIESLSRVTLDTHELHMECWASIIPVPAQEPTRRQSGEYNKLLAHIGLQVIRAYEGEQEQAEISRVKHEGRVVGINLSTKEAQWILAQDKKEGRMSNVERNE